MLFKKIVFNKYLIAIIAFVIWMIFFDQNSYLLHKKLDKDLKNLAEEKAYYEAEIKIESTALHQFKNNPKEIEKLAREKFLMKKPNEDIFVIVKPLDTISK